jgi:hypothetical protein
MSKGNSQAIGTIDRTMKRPAIANMIAGRLAIVIVVMFLSPPLCSDRQQMVEHFLQHIICKLHCRLAVAAFRIACYGPFQLGSL